MKEKVAEEEKNGNPNFTHFSAEANELEMLEEVFEEYGRKGTGSTRTYVHDEEEAEALRHAARHVHRMARLPAEATCSSTKACTAASSPTRSTSPRMPT